MVPMKITVATDKGENTMPAKPQHNKTFWMNGQISMEAASNPHAAAGINKVLRAAGVVNPKTKVCKSKTLDVKSTSVHVYLDGITFEGPSKEEGWSRLSKPLPYTIQVKPKKYTFIIRTISPEICVHYGRRKCCWKAYSPHTRCAAASSTAPTATTSPSSAPRTCWRPCSRARARRRQRTRPTSPRATRRNPTKEDEGGRAVEDAAKGTGPNSKGSSSQEMAEGPPATFRSGVYRLSFPAGGSSHHPSGQR